MSTALINERKNSTVTWEEAQAMLCRAAAPAEQVICPLNEALERILAEDLTAPCDQPPFRRSAMDGYALQSRDIAGACLSAPVSLPVKGCLYAGDAPLPAGSLKPGEAIRIMTGAPVPEDANLVIRQEDTDEGEKTVQIYADGGGRSNISPAGEDFAGGECLITKGTFLDAYALSCACAAGFAALPVRRKVRAGLVMTGNELCPPGRPLKPGKIYNSNEAFLKGRLSQLGCTVAAAVYTEDDQEKITKTILQMAPETDLIITTGGVSAGKRDLVPAALEAAGAELLFHGVAIKPGMPTLGAVYEGSPILGLSGNPYSAAAVFELLGRPLIHHMLCRKGEPFTKASALLENDIIQNGSTPRVMMGVFDGMRVRVHGKQRNAQMKYGIGSNCMVILPPEQKIYRAGEKIEILL